MRTDRRGYTLIELIIVVLIIGILASFGVPQYLRTVETSKADDAVSTMNMIGTTNKMFALDHAGVYAVGQFPTDGPCATGACAAPWTACDLVYCKYLADQSWNTRPYDYWACDGAAGTTCGGMTDPGPGSPVAAVNRKDSASDSYANWGYTMNTSGVITLQNGAPAPTY
jgi:prepilin-type N-terminal cleavage/methylation domain-containing protein